MTLPKYVTGHDPVCVEICEALGIKHARKLELKLACDGLATVTVEFYAEKDGVKQLPAILRKYRLAPIEDEVDVTTLGSTVREFKKAEDIA